MTALDNKRFSFKFFLALYLLCFVGYSLIPAIRTPVYIQTFLALFTVHSLIGFWMLYRYSKQINNSSIILWSIFIVSRLAVFPMMPWLSDDVFGYLWHGTLTLNGWNCYVYPANSPEVVYLRNDLYDLLAYKTHPAIYPPLAEIFITLGVWLGHLFSQSWQSALFGWKAVLLCAETFGFWFLLRSRKFSTFFSPGLYILLPLTAIEIIGQGHNDGLVIAPLGALIFALAIMKNNPESKYSEWLKGFLLGAMTMIKLIPVVMILPFLNNRIHNSKKLIIIISTGTTIVLFGLIFFYDYRAVDNFTGILKFYNQTQFNSPLLHLVRRVLDVLHVPNWWLVAPNSISLLRFGALVALCFRFFPVKPDQLIFNILAIYTSTTLISPKVHTWYFVPLLFLNCVVGWKWLAFGASAMMLTYSMYAVLPAVEPLFLESVLWLLMIIVATWEFTKDYSFRSKT